MQNTNRAQESGYKASLTREQFLFNEIRIVAKQMVQGEDLASMIQIIAANNLFQYPTDGKRNEARCQKDYRQQQIARKQPQGQVYRRIDSPHGLSRLCKGPRQDENPYHQHDVLVGRSCGVLQQAVV